MSLPGAEAVLASLAASWPPASARRAGPWTIREGRGGGGRVSAATLDGAPGDVGEAEAAMRALGQVPLFMVRDGEEALDAELEARGYRVIDPVILYAAAPEAVAAEVPSATAFGVWPPVAVQAEIWAEDGIGPARLAVMERAAPPKAAILGRLGERPAGCVFVSAAGGIAMAHALTTRAGSRRRGLGRRLMQAAAAWCAAEGCEALTLVVTQANVPAIALYEGLGFARVGTYHYRSEDGTK